MSTARIPLVHVLTGAALLAALAGCSLLPSAPSASGGTEATTSDPAPDDGGDEDDPVVSLPDTFPSDIPLVDGDILESTDLGTGWVVLFGVDDAISSFDEGADALAGAGFAEAERTTTETQGFANYTNDLYTVQISANTDYPGYGQAVSYTVVKLG